MSQLRKIRFHGSEYEIEPNKINFTSNDESTPTEWNSVEIVNDNEEYSSFFNKISTMFKNIRYLYNMLGSTDISGIDNGTITGAIKSLNSSNSTNANNISELNQSLSQTNQRFIQETFSPNTSQTLTLKPIKNYILVGGCMTNGASHYLILCILTTTTDSVYYTNIHNDWAITIATNGLNLTINSTIYSVVSLLEL